MQRRKKLSKSTQCGSGDIVIVMSNLIDKIGCTEILLRWGNYGNNNGGNFCRFQHRHLAYITRAQSLQSLLFQVNDNVDLFNHTDHNVINSSFRDYLLDVRNKTGARIAISCLFLLAAYVQDIFIYLQGRRTSTPKLKPAKPLSYAQIIHKRV